MKTTSIAVVLLLLTLLTSCAGKRRPKDIIYDEDLQGTLDMPSYTRNALDGWPEGRRLDPYDASRVRLPEKVHAYHVGRLPSRDRREMHEAHTVYRVDQSERWDQRLPATPMSSTGVVLGIREPSHDPVPKDEVLRSERARQAGLTQQIEQQVVTLREKGQQIEAFLASAPDKNKTILELQQSKETTEKELAALQQEYQKVKEDLQQLQERQKMEEALQMGTKKP
jgi:hypothetical protein